MTAFPVLFQLSQLPYSYGERLALENEIRMPATFNEYLEFAEKAEYKVEYSNGHIISMGQPTDTHELICGNVIAALNFLFFEGENPYRVYGSNLGVYIQENGSHYKPDATILNTEPVLISHKVRKHTLKSVLNPLAVVEVFSDGTMDYEMTDKLPDYKQCSSLRYIIYIHQSKPFVSIHFREETGPVWRSNEFRGLDASFSFEGKTVLLKNIYRNVIFMGNAPSKKGKKKV
jgi:Uma2 family endonuclease